MASYIHSAYDVRRQAQQLATMPTGRGIRDPEEWLEGAIGQGVIRALRMAPDPDTVVAHIVDTTKWRPDATQVRHAIISVGAETTRRTGGDHSACRDCDWSGWRQGWTHKRLHGEEMVTTWVCACDCEKGRHYSTARTGSEPPLPATPQATELRGILNAEPLETIHGGHDGLLGWWMQGPGDGWRTPPLVGLLADPEWQAAKVKGGAAGSWGTGSR